MVRKKASARSKKRVLKKKTRRKPAKRVKRAAKRKAVKKAKRVKRTVKRKAVKKAKRVAKKKPVRKAKRVKKAAKRRIRKDPSAAQRILSRKRVYNLTREVPEHNYFILANGKPVKHVAELASILDQLEDHVFSHHVTSDKNDFHSWIKDVFEDVELARKISKVGQKKHLQLVIYRHLAGHDKR